MSNLIDDTLTPEKLIYDRLVGILYLRTKYCKSKFIVILTFEVLPFLRKNKTSDDTDFITDRVYKQLTHLYDWNDFINSFNVYNMFIYKTRVRVNYFVIFFLSKLCVLGSNILRVLKFSFFPPSMGPFSRTYDRKVMKL